MITKILNFINDSYLKEILRSNFIYTALVKILIIFQYLIIIKIAALRLSETELGNFFIIYNSVLLFSGLLFASQSSSLLRYFSITENKKELYKTILIQICTPIICCLMTYMFIYISFDIDNPLLFLLSLLFSLGAGVMLVILTQLRVSGRFKDYFLVVLIQTLAVVIFLLSDFITINVFNIFLILMASQVISILFFLYKVSGKLKSITKQKFSKPLSMDLLVYGLPFMLIAASNSLISAYGQYILKYLDYESEVGIFAINYSVGEKLIFVFFSILITYKVPEIYLEARNNIKGAIKLINSTALLFISYSLTILLLLSFISKYISTLVSTNDIAQDGHWIILMAIISATLLGIFSLYSEVLLSLKKSGIVAFNYLLLVFIGIMLSYIMIISYGIFGAAIAPIIANLIGLIILRFQISRHT